MEIWRDVYGYEGFYQVSNCGNVRSVSRTVQRLNNSDLTLRGRVCSQTLSDKGYLTVGLCRDNRIKRVYVHKLVAIAFVDNPNNLTEINHIDENPLNNRVDNLEWCTQSENEQHSHSILGNTMKGKTYPKKVKCLDTGIIYKSMLTLIKEIGKNSCIEGLKKAIKNNRPYHGKHYSFI